MATVSRLSGYRTQSFREGPAGSSPWARCRTTAVLLALVAGCGGKSTGDTTPVGEASSEGEPAAGAGDMISPEAMDEINRNLDRKRRIISHCLAVAVDSKELPKNSAGKITLEIVISPDGKAETVKVVRATLESKMLTDCVIARVREIQFPQLPRPFPTSYTYGFEAM